MEQLADLASGAWMLFDLIVIGRTKGNESFAALKQHFGDIEF